MRLPVSYLLTCVAAHAVRRVSGIMAESGLTVRQYGVMVQLRVEPGLTMSDLARQLGISRQALHEMTAELEKAGHLTRVPGASGRTKTLALAPSSGPMLDRLHRRLLQEERNAFLLLSNEEVDHLREYLGRVLGNVTDDETWLAQTARPTRPGRGSASSGR